jgi:hypothetical protein
VARSDQALAPFFRFLMGVRSSGASPRSGPESSSYQGLEVRRPRAPKPDTPISTEVGLTAVLACKALVLACPFLVLVCLLPLTTYPYGVAPLVLSASMAVVAEDEGDLSMWPVVIAGAIVATIIGGLMLIMLYNDDAPPPRLPTVSADVSTP